MKHEAHRKWGTVTWKCVLKQQILNATEKALPCSHSQGTICTCPHSSDDQSHVDCCGCVASLTPLPTPLTWSIPDE